MTDPDEEDITVHLTVDDARTAQAAGIKFTHTLTGAHAGDFALALAEQEHLIQRAITNAGYSATQADLAAREFAAAAALEWQRIADASGSEVWGQARKKPCGNPL
jgi:hypothetical protein